MNISKFCRYQTRGAKTYRQCVRAVKEMDSKSIGLCPQGFESPRCRFGDAVAMQVILMCNLQAARDLPMWDHGQREQARNTPSCIGLVIVYTFDINAAMARVQMRCRHISAENFRIEDRRRFFSCDIFCCKIILSHLRKN